MSGCQSIIYYKIEHWALSHGQSSVETYTAHHKLLCQLFYWYKCQVLGPIVQCSCNVISVNHLEVGSSREFI